MNIYNYPSSCAACIFQGREEYCTNECILAPYFPLSRPIEFINAEKLFGVTNITNVLRQQVDPGPRYAAARALIYAANARAKDPVGGCPAYIPPLYEQIIQALQNEYDVLVQLSQCQYLNQHVTQLAQTQTKMAQTLHQMAEAQRERDIFLQVYRLAGLR